MVSFSQIEVMMSSLESLNVLPSTRASVKEKESQDFNRVHGRDSANIGENESHRTYTKLALGSLPVTSIAHSHAVTLPNALRTGMPGVKSRAVLLPLLDLHKDHDADSLPSPTREAPSCFPVHKTLAVGDESLKSGFNAPKVALETEESRMLHYETDALKAVSTYQQKFGRSTISFNDQLPSPTPSEEYEIGDSDTNGEVSSSFTASNLRTASTPILGQPVFSLPTPVISSSIQGPITTKNAAPVSSLSNPTVKASAKSRDPRLRYANSDVGSSDLNQRTLPMVHNSPKIEPIEPVNSRKQRTFEEPNMDGPSSKKQRKGLEKSGIVSDVKTVAGGGGWLEDSVNLGPQLSNKNTFTENAEVDRRTPISVVSCPTNSPNAGNEKVPVASTSTIASLPALLKDIAVNPTMLLNILKLGQHQRLAAETQQKSADPATVAIHPPSSNSVPGAAPMVNNASSMASRILQTSAGTPAVPSQMPPIVSASSCSFI